MIAATALALLGALAGCARGGRESADPPEKAVLAYAALPQGALAVLAQACGFFRQEGVEVTAHPHGFGKAALDELLAGRADLATVAEVPFMFAVLGGEKIAIVATISNARKNEALVARRDRGILSPADLKGRRVGATAGTSSNFFLGAFLAAHGVSLQEVAVVDLKPADMEQALERGEVDAVATFVPYLAEVQKSLGTRGVTFYDEEVYTEIFNVVARREYIRRHPRTIGKILRALLKAEEFAQQDPALAQDRVARFTRTDPAAVRQMWHQEAYAVTLDQALLLALEDETAWAIKGGLVAGQKVPNYLDYIYLDGLRAVKPDAVRILR